MEKVDNESTHDDYRLPPVGGEYFSTPLSSTLPNTTTYTYILDLSPATQNVEIVFDWCQNKKLDLWNLH